MTTNKAEWLIIINPMAGGGKGKKQWKTIETLLLENGFVFEAVFTKRKGHAIEIIADKIKEGFRKIIALGGDGTNNEATNGVFMQNHVSPSEIIYTLIPIGTGNDWTRSYNIPKKFKEWIPKIKKEKIHQQDIGIVTYFSDGEEKKRYFTNVAGMAYDGHIAKLVCESEGGVGNQLIYLYMILRQLFKYKNEKVRIEYDGKSHEGAVYTINIGINKYSGGGMQFVPHAVNDDGLLALTYDTGISKMDVLALTPKLYGGKVIQDKRVKFDSVKEVKVVSQDDKEVFVEVDGEYLGTTPCTFSLMERVLNVIVP